MYLQQRDIPYKLADNRWGVALLHSTQHMRTFEFFPGLISFVALQDMSDIFNGVSKIYRSDRRGTCPYFSHDYTSGELFRDQYFHPFFWS